MPFLHAFSACLFCMPFLHAFSASYIEAINWYLTNEDGILLDMQGGRFEATIVISWPAAKGDDPPPSSFAARTNLSQVLQPWALPNKSGAR